MKIEVSELPSQIGAVVLAAVSASCAPDSPGDIHQRWTVERVEHGDTSVVRTIRGSVWRDTMELVPEVRIGVLDGEEEYLFGSIRGLDVDRNGRIIVIDGLAADIRIFSGEGDHVRTIGRQGDGPGEFRRPDHVRVTTDGRIIVRDQPARFSVIAEDGTYLGGWLLQSGFATNTPFYVTPGNVIMNPTLPDGLVRYELDGTILDTVDVPGRGYSPPRLEVTMQGGRASYSVPFSPSERWSATRDGRFLFGTTDTYRIDRSDAGGNVLRIERSVQPVPVWPDESAQARQRMIRAIRSANDPSWRWSGPDLPSIKPAWWNIIPGMDHSLWVIRSTPAVEEPNPEWDSQKPDEGFPTRWVEPVVADVFDEEGRYLGPVRIPPEVRLFPLPVVTVDRMWAAAVHEMGYPQVVRYRLETLREESVAN